MDESIKRKLTSRKFWIAVAGFVTALLTAFHVADGSIAQIVAIIMAFADIVIYVFAESYVDAQHTNDFYYINEVDNDKD